MKAIVYHEYGSADVLKYEDTPKPAPKDNEVLIRVRAASINPIDWRLMKGKPRVVRLMAALAKLNAGIPGVDAAGVVEAIGKSVTQFKPGDEVFGSVRAACAEYACAAESKVALKPAGVTFEQAASLNVAGLTALQGVRDHAKVQPGQKVLINGAAGGVGMFAVQLAKIFGAEVTGVCSPSKLELIKSIGADAVIDYTKEDFTKPGKTYDVILDCVGSKSQSECRRVLNPNGKIILIGAPHDATLSDMFVPLIKAMLSSPFTSRKAIPMLGKASKADLSFLAELIVQGKLTPVIDRTYALSEGAAAVGYVAEGHAAGKVVVTMNSDH